MAKKTFKRKKILVDKEFQAKFVFNVYLAIVIMVILLGILIVYMSSQEMTGSVYSKITTIRSTNQIILPLVLKISIGVLIIAFIFVGIKFLKFSHKIAGPMFRFKRTLQSIKEGDLTTYIKFRKKDELQDVALLLSETIKELNRRITKIRKNTDSLGTLLKKNKITKKDMEKLRSNHKEIMDILKQFKL